MSSKLHSDHGNNVNFITVIGTNDVLLGRGNHNRNPGNDTFRSIVQSRSMEYWSYKDNTSRDNVVRQIIETVHSNQGRFLRKVGVNQSYAAGVTSNKIVTQWTVADTATVMVKIKQTLRDMTVSIKRQTTSVKQGNNKMIPSVSSQLGTSIPSLNHPESMQLSSMQQNDNAEPSSDSLFESARIAQLTYLLQNTQQERRQQSAQDEQFMSLLEQQRAKLDQLQQSQLTLLKSSPVMDRNQHSAPPQHVPYQSSQEYIQGELVGRSSTAPNQQYQSSPNIQSYLSNQLSQIRSDDLLPQLQLPHSSNQGNVAQIPPQQWPGPQFGGNDPAWDTESHVTYTSQNSQQQQEQLLQVQQLQLATIPGPYIGLEGVMSLGQQAQTPTNQLNQLTYIPMPNHPNSSQIATQHLSIPGENPITLLHHQPLLLPQTQSHQQIVEPSLLLSMMMPQPASQQQQQQQQVEYSTLSGSTHFGSAFTVVQNPSAPQFSDRVPVPLFRNNTLVGHNSQSTPVTSITVAIHPHQVPSTSTAKTCSTIDEVSLAIIGNKESTNSPEKL